MTPPRWPGSRFESGIWGVGVSRGILLECWDGGSGFRRSRACSPSVDDQHEIINVRDAVAANRRHIACAWNTDWAGPPVADDRQEIIDVDDAVAAAEWVDVAGTRAFKHRNIAHILAGANLVEGLGDVHRETDVPVIQPRWRRDRRVGRAQRRQ